MGILNIYSRVLFFWGKVLQHFKEKNFKKFAIYIQKKNNPLKSRHYVPLQRPRAAHAFRSDQHPIKHIAQISLKFNFGGYTLIYQP